MGEINRACLTRILVNSMDLSGRSNSVSIDMSAQAIEYSVFMTCHTLRIPQEPIAVIDHAGYFFGRGAGDLEDVFYSTLGDALDATVTVILDTQAEVPYCYTVRNTWNDQLKFGGQVGQLVTVAGRWPSENHVIFRGRQYFTGVKSVAGDILPGLDNLAAKAEAKLLVHVHTITGTTTGIIVNVKSSANADMSSATDHGDLTIGAVGAFILDLVSLKKYVLVSIEDLGGATSFDSTVVIGG